ncbi:AAA family ATPase [Shewanella sp. 1_MG-2023]|uniref:ATP-dependent nuclease n=1 Tax=unclassified Shewanella TaxID=196818 RepID=UPI0026E3F66D|nr:MULTISPECIES: AAA family ATPase [unclassified Shewanella]MDO6610530.1 AAA family ATPase [Shewanella sp. 7_MG-2023]MDO6770655.1 AAA family ATPase [Shewanella sp. 2_MG-2023]MDO6795041.1 AAA family ATPase [Shewanella sp. 1_MG-2023]
MHISRVTLRNYRNFRNSNFVLKEGVNTIVGENGSGKTNVFRAIRLLLDDNLRRSAMRLEETDFFRGLDDWRGHWIIVSLEFSNLSADEAIQSLFFHGAAGISTDESTTATYNLVYRPKPNIRKQLSDLTHGDKAGLQAILDTITIEDYETRITGRSTADFSNDEEYKAIVGDFENAIFPSEVSNHQIGTKLGNYFSIYDDISFTYIKALRDVVSDFHNNRTNPLLQLLKAKSGDINHQEFETIVATVQKLNGEIESLSDVSQVRGDIHSTLVSAAGHTYSPKGMSIESGLSDKAEEIFQSLSLRVGEDDSLYEGSIHEISLGGANLIFLALKLLSFKYQQRSETFANILLIEEPEAHIHTHIQRTLFQNLDYQDTQIIYSTHSTHISDVSNVESMNIIGKTDSGYKAFQPATGLDPKEVRAIQRYLDAKRSNLLFSKSCILVEGDAEEILIPIMIKKVLGISVDEIGMSVINIGSTGFDNVAKLFDDSRINKKCSIVTDLDATFFGVDDDPADNSATKAMKKKAIGSAESGEARKAKLDEDYLNNSWVGCFYADHTFEVDYIKMGNQQSVIALLPDVYKTDAKILEATEQLNSGLIHLSGYRALTIANQEGKGWFAIQLGDTLTPDCALPSYIARAISFAHGKFEAHILSKIIHHRIQYNFSQGIIPNGELAPSSLPIDQAIQLFDEGKLPFNILLDSFKRAYSSDSAISAIETFSYD